MFRPTGWEGPHVGDTPAKGGRADSLLNERSRHAPSSIDQPRSLGTTCSLAALPRGSDAVKHSVDFILNREASTQGVHAPDSTSQRWKKPPAVPREPQLAIRAGERATAKRTARSNVPIAMKSSVRKVTREMTKDEKRLARHCAVDGCANYIITRGRCFRHGGGKRCSVEGCDASAKVAGCCWKHGGSNQCTVDGCDRRGKSRGLCWAHGGGTRCHTVGCGKVAISHGLCWAHGGGKRCQIDGCKRPAYERTLNYCPVHYHRFESGKDVMEL